MKIVSIRAHRVDLPLVEGDYKWSGGKSVSVFDSTIVRVDTDAGITGWGEVCPLGPFYLPAYAAGARAAAIPVPQLPVQPRRVGRGIDAAFQRAGKTVADRARHRAAALQPVERLRDPLAASRFAVGAGHTDHPQPRTGPAVHVAGDKAALPAQLRHRQVPDAPRRLPLECRRLPQHGIRARQNGVRDKVAAIARFSGIGNKGIARANSAAVARKPPDA